MTKTNTPCGRCSECNSILYAGGQWEPMLTLSGDHTSNACHIEHVGTCYACIDIAERALLDALQDTYGDAFEAFTPAPINADSLLVACNAFALHSALPTM